MAADVGTLQRLPKLIGNDSAFRELAYTARNFGSQEASSLGIVSKILPDKEAVVSAALETAELIASKSPVAVAGTKVCLNYARDHTVDEGLEYIANWNMVMLQSKDLQEAMTAAMTKTKPNFKDF